MRRRHVDKDVLESVRDRDWVCQGLSSLRVRANSEELWNPFLI